MRFTKISSWVLAIILFAGTMRAEERYKVIAHPSVPLTSIGAKDLSPIFLKKVTSYAKWGNEQKAVVVDLKPDSPTREAFTKSVHGRAVNAIRAFWQQQIFSGRGTPPPELSNDAEVIASVARTPGALGYVSADATLPSGVKQVRVTQ